MCENYIGSILITMAPNFRDYSISTDLKEKTAKKMLKKASTQIKVDDNIDFNEGHFITLRCFEDIILITSCCELDETKEILEQTAS